MYTEMGRKRWVEVMSKEMGHSVRKDGRVDAQRNSWIKVLNKSPGVSIIILIN